jgi:hypothetical protein
LKKLFDTHGKMLDMRRMFSEDTKRAEKYT